MRVAPKIARSLGQVAQAGKHADGAVGQAHDPSSQAIPSAGRLHHALIRRRANKANRKAMDPGQRPGELLRERLPKSLQLEAPAFDAEEMHCNRRRVTPERCVGDRANGALLCLSRDDRASRECRRWRLAEEAPILCREAPEMGKSEPCSNLGNRRAGARCKQCLARGGKTQPAEIRKRREPKESHEMTLQRAFRHFAEPGELRHTQRMRQRSAHIGERKSDIAGDRDARGRPGYLPIAIWRHGLLRRRLLNASSTNDLTVPNKHRPRAARRNGEFGASRMAVAESG